MRSAPPALPARGSAACVVRALTLLASLLATGCGESPSVAPANESGAAAPARPHVVVWLVDTLRADHLGCYGYARPTSPQLDALAAQGVLFAAAHVNANWTLPSVTSLLSGRYPPAFGEAFDVAVPDDVLLLPQWFTAHGYQATGMTMTIATAAAFGFDRGFDSYRELDAEADDHARRMREGPAFDADRLVDAALHWIDRERDPGRPFLLHLHSVDPHVPYETHPGQHSFTGAYEGPIDGRTDTLRDAFLQAYAFTAADRQHLIDLYDDEVAFSDAQLGRLVAGLRERGLFDDTLLVVVSDHGEEFWDRNSHGHGHRNLHAELTHVPLVLSWPAGLPAGHRVEGLVRGIDLAPTLVELAGLPPLGRADGTSLAAVARGDAELPESGRPLFAHRSKEPLDVMALRTPALLYHADPKGITSGVYDLRNDPDARHDLTRDDPTREDAPKRLLFEWLRERGRRAAGLGAGRRSLDLDEETRAALRAMGYLGDDG